MTTPKASGRECITHHHACDCREARVAKLVEALTEINLAIMDAGNNAVAWIGVQDRIAAATRAALDEWRKG